MREIKFRCWNVATKSIYPNEHFALTMDGDELQLMTSCEHYDKPYLLNNSGNMIYMQYTGLKDKNDIEIYEGDIVKVFDVYNYEKCKSETVIQAVDWDTDMGGFFVGAMWSYDGMEKSWDELEVIGNIYENPDLLKEPK